MQIDNKFVPRVCKALIHKLVTTKNKQHKQQEVQLLVFNLIKEIMQTPLTEFEKQASKTKNKDSEGKKESKKKKKEKTKQEEKDRKAFNRM